MRIQKLIILFLTISLFSMEMKAQEIKVVPRFLNPKYYEGNKEINNKELTAVIEKDIVAYSHLKKAKTFKVLSWVALTSELGFATWGIVNKDYRDNTTIDNGVYVSFAGVIAFSVLSYIQKNKAIAKYNQGLSKPTVFSIMPSKTGLGIVMQF